jgi:hypothetical protein
MLAAPDKDPGVSGKLLSVLDSSQNQIGSGSKGWELEMPK